MYAAYFGLKENPFSLSPEPRSFSSETLISRHSETY